MGKLHLRASLLFATFSTLLVTPLMVPAHSTPAIAVAEDDSPELQEATETVKIATNTTPMKFSTAKRTETPVQRYTNHASRSYNTAGVEQWRTLVSKYFAPANVNAALSVMRKESGGNPNSTNRSSGCAGLFQIHPCHITKFRQVTGTSNMYDPEANIRFAAYMSQRGTNWSSWSVSP